MIQFELILLACLKQVERQSSFDLEDGESVMCANAKDMLKKKTKSLNKQGKLHNLWVT